MGIIEDIHKTKYDKQPISVNEQINLLESNGMEFFDRSFKNIRFPKMIQLDESKLAALPTTNDLLDEKFGVDGTPRREEFNAKAMAWYYGTLLRDRRLQRTQRGNHCGDR